MGAAMNLRNPERIASFTRALIEEAAALVAIALAIATIGLWVLIIADKVQ